MCFIKVSHKGLDIQSAFQKAPTETQIISEQQPKSNTVFQDCLNFIASINLEIVQQINKNIDSNIQNIENMNKILEEMTSNNVQTNEEENSAKNKQIDPLLKRTFGEKNFKYSLHVYGRTPKTLYKERNFDLKVVLINEKGEIVNNANPISLYFGVMTCEGEWVEFTRQGQNMVKGLNQLDLHRGAANFNKLYIREISSSYPQKKLNFVVYPKENLLKYTACTNVEQTIFSKDIKPLLIKDVNILSKRK